MVLSFVFSDHFKKTEHVTLFLITQLIHECILILKNSNDAEKNTHLLTFLLSSPNPLSRGNPI